MADVTVYATAHVASWRKTDRSQVFVSPLVGYQFFADDVSNDLVYSKTTDGGLIWGSAVTVRTGTVGLSSGFSVWYDKWTPGGTGTTIHIAYIDEGVDDVFYRALNTATDTLGTEITVFAGASSDTTAQVSIAKMRGGNIDIAFDFDGGTEIGFYVSTDAGANFNAKATTGLHEVSVDEFSIFPGGDADNQDCWCLFLDVTADELSLKVYDDSGDSWSEAAIGTMVNGTLASHGHGFSASVRHSDNHLIVAFFNARDAAGADLVVYDITNAGTITAKTNVLTDKDDTYNPVVFINQTTNRIYVGILGKGDGSETLGTSVSVVYYYSDDGGTAWSAEQAYSETAGNYTSLHADLGGVNSRWIPTFMDGGANDLFVNVVNSSAIGSAGGSSPGNSGNAPGRSRGNPTPGGGKPGGGGGGNGGGPLGGQLQKAFWGRRRRTR